MAAMTSPPTRTPLTPSAAIYLVTILRIMRDQSAAAPSEISDRMDVGRSSVTHALRLLREHRYIHYVRYKKVTLTEEGRRVAMRLEDRQRTIRDFFIHALGMAEATAAKMAARIAHEVTAEMAARLSRLLHHSSPGIQTPDNRTGFFEKAAVPIVAEI